MKKVTIKNSLKLLKIISCLFLGSSFLSAQVEENDSLKYFKRTSYLTDNAKLSDLDLLVDSLVKGFMQGPENCGLSIAVTQIDKTSFYNYGEMSRNSGNLADKNTIYEIGSLTASFCGMLMAQAVTEKKIKAEDDIRNYLPGKFPELHFNNIAIKVKHLLTHSSGLPQIPDDLTTKENYNPEDPYKNYSKEQIFNFLQRVKLPYVPGKVTDYSSLGIALSGIILESIYKMPFDSLVKEKITNPLSMLNTAKNLTSTQMQNSAAGYKENGEPAKQWTMNAFEAAGGMRSSTADLTIYLQKFHDLKDPAVKLSLEPEKESGKERTSFSWLIKKTNKGDVLYYQSGGTLGTAGFMGGLKKNKSGVVVLSNSGRNIDYIAIGILNYLQK